MESSIDLVNSARRWTASNTVLSVGFGLTGSGTVMLGVLLPSLAQKWGMRDDVAGLLLLAQFVGSSMGAILTGADRVRALRNGYGLLVASACALAFAGRDASFAFFFLFGMGLGMTMTATSLLFSEQFGDDRAAKLERINFAWSAGAAAAPLLLARLLHGSSFGALFELVEVLFLLFFVWVTLRDRAQLFQAPAKPVALAGQGLALSGFLVPLVAMATCSVGVETSLSGWLTMYSHRAAPMSREGSAIAASLFWFGILLSRLAFSTRLLAIVGRKTVLGWALCGAAASVALLLAAHSPAAIRGAAGLAGFCIGPLYPLVLSFILERCQQGWIFAVAGIGSSFLPWLTGVVSAHSGSLRRGLMAPCCAAFLMIALYMVGFWRADSQTASGGRPVA